MQRLVHTNRWAVFAVGIIAQVVFSGTFLGLPAASLFLQGSYQLNAGELALLLGSASIAVVLVETPWGMAADRFGERRVLLTGVTCTVGALGAVAAVSASASPPVWMLAVLLFIAAAAGGAVTGPSGSAILGWFGASRHGTLVSLRVAAVPVGGAVGTLAYSALFTHLGAAPTFLIMAAACAVCALLVAFFVADPPRSSATALSGTAPSKATHPFRSVAVLRTAASGLLLDITQFLILTYAAVMLSEIYDLPVAGGIAAVAVMQLAGGAFRVLLGVGTDLIPALTRPAVVRALSALQAVCLAILLLGSERLPLPLAVGAFVIAGIASCAWQGAHFTHIASLAGPRSAGAALGLNNAATSLGAFIPQVLAGAMLATDWSKPLLLLGVAPAILAIWIFPSGRTATREMDRVAGGQIARST